MQSMQTEQELSDAIETFNYDPDSMSGERSGSGMFSEVDLSPCGKYAIKYGNHAFADGWLLYAAALLELPKEERPRWAPRIHSLRVDLERGTFVALMDALIPYEPTEEPPVEGGHVQDFFVALYGEGCDNTYHACECYTCEAKRVVALYPEYGDCVSFLEDIESETGVPLYFDIEGNVMKDAEGENILNDPVCVSRWHCAKKDHRYRAQIDEFVRECASNSPDIHIKG